MKDTTQTEAPVGVKRKIKTKQNKKKERRTYRKKDRKPPPPKQHLCALGRRRLQHDSSLLSPLSLPSFSHKWCGNVSDKAEIPKSCSVIRLAFSHHIFPLQIRF
ncbi:protein kinase, putative [Trypanosoma cruzi]|nr:protein kinase, putative [Trypanosoma cruzi]